MSFCSLVLKRSALLRALGLLSAKLGSRILQEGRVYSPSRYVLCPETFVLERSHRLFPGRSIVFPTDVGRIGAILARLVGCCDSTRAVGCISVCVSVPLVSDRLSVSIVRLMVLYCHSCPLSFPLLLERSHPSGRVCHILRSSSAVGSSPATDGGQRPYLGLFGHFSLMFLLPLPSSPFWPLVIATPFLPPHLLQWFRISVRRVLFSCTDLGSSV